jgi:hypothetical protein
MRSSISTRSGSPDVLIGAVAGVAQPDLLQRGGIHPLLVRLHVVHGDAHRLHVEAVEADPGRAAGVLVVAAHPLDHLQHLPGVPGPEAEVGEQHRRIAHSGVDVVVDTVGLRPGRLDAEGGEAHLPDQELEDAMLHLEELARAVRRLPERHDARVADDLLERHQVRVVAARLRGAELNGVLPQPGEFRIRGLRGGRITAARQESE